jgi:hypothetical protein
MKIWIDYQDDDIPSVEAEVDAVPRIGEKVGVRQPDGMEGSQHFALDFVVDVRHYLAPPHEIRVLTSSRR